VPAEIDSAQYLSLVALFEESFAKYRNDNAYACMDKKLTYGQLDEMSRALGAWLQSKGLARGDRVAIMMPNVLQYPVCVAGNPQAMGQRPETVEHPFGTLKMRMGATHFLMKRLPKVASEMALLVLAYNLTRVMNIVGVKPLIAAIRA